MDPKLRMFLFERDRARARQDWGVYRSLTADLRSWGISDEATLANPSGKIHRSRAKPEEGTVAAVADPEAKTDSEAKVKGGRPKLPRCEHGQVVDRCPECNEDLPTS